MMRNAWREVTTYLVIHFGYSTARLFSKSLIYHSVFYIMESTLTNSRESCEEMGYCKRGG